MFATLRLDHRIKGVRTVWPKENRKDFFVIRLQRRKVSEAEFDEIFGRVKAERLVYSDL
jgi:hypothetical protein